MILVAIHFREVEEILEISEGGRYQSYIVCLADSTDNKTVQLTIRADGWAKVHTIITVWKWVKVTLSELNTITI